MFKVLVADDEGHGRRRFCEMLNKYPDIEIIAVEKNGNGVLKTLKKNTIDIAFLDINMPGQSVFKTISELPLVPLIVFQTAYSEYAVEAYGLDAIDYLLKPVSQERLSQCIEKLRNSLKLSKSETVNSQISVKDGSVNKLINIKKVYALCSEESQSYVITEEGKYYTEKTLSYLEVHVPKDDFYRISRETIINTEFVKSLQPLKDGLYKIELEQNLFFNVSRRRLKGFKKFLSTKSI